MRFLAHQLAILQSTRSKRYTQPKEEQNTKGQIHRVEMESCNVRHISPNSRHEIRERMDSEMFDVRWFSDVLCMQQILLKPEVGKPLQCSQKN